MISGENHVDNALEHICSVLDMPIYRETIFSDETESVVRKATKAPIEPSPLSCSEAPLTPCIEERAKKLFISQYVFCKTGRFPYMDHFWLARPRHAHLAMGLRAVSLVCLSIELRSDEILRRARQRYSLALRLTNAALRCPQSAKNNATLLTVFLLYLYEKLTRKSVHDDSGESMHLSGAITLLQLSGASQFDDDAVRLLLFRQVSMSVFLKCLRHGDEAPPYLLSMRQSINVADQEGHLEGLIARFTALRSSVRKGELVGCEVYAGSSTIR